MWPVILFVLAILVSAGAALSSSGPSLPDAQAVAQAQTIRRIALEAAHAARVQLTGAPGLSLPSIGMPTTLPSAALYGRRDVFLPYSTLVPGGHEWLPTARASKTAALPALSAGESSTDGRAYEVGVADCAVLRAVPMGDPLWAAYVSACPPAPTNVSQSYYRARPSHVLVIKAGWLGPGRPTQISDPNEVAELLRRDFGLVYVTRLESWRTNGGQAIDSFVIRL